MDAHDRPHDAPDAESHGSGEHTTCLARTVAGGFAGRTREAIHVDVGGNVHALLADGTELAGHLSAEQVGLVADVCASTDFRLLPRFVDGPMTRSDGYTWTYRVGEHAVSMRDPDRAGAATPRALTVIDGVIAGILARLAATAPDHREHA